MLTAALVEFSCPRLTFVSKKKKKKDRKSYVLRKFLYVKLIFRLETFFSDKRKYDRTKNERKNATGLKLS